MLAIYTRLSREDEANNSIYNQKREGKEFAKKNKFKDYKIYDEGQGISGGAKIEDRPKFSELIEDIIKSKITTVWFRDQNRLERNQLTFHFFVDLVQQKHISIYIADKLIDYNDPDTFFRTSLDSLYNTKKRIEQGVATKKALHGNLKEGRTRGGIMPYGYSKDEKGYIIIDSNEAEVIKRIYDLSLEGIGTTQIAEILNKENVPTRYSKMDGTITFTHKDTKKKRTVKKKDIKWAGATIRGIIKNECYKGIKYLGKKEERKAYPYPIIIEPYHWEKVNKNLPKNRNNSGKRVEHKYLLKGLIRCGKCGRNYAGRSRMPKEGRAYRQDHVYKCSSIRKGYETCGNRGINITKIESFIIKLMFYSGHIQYLAEQIKNGDALKKMENQLEAFEVEQKQIKKKEDKLYKLLLNEALEEDKRLINDYTSTKGKLTAISLKIKNLKNKIETEKNTDRLGVLEGLINNFSVENNFKTIQSQVRQINENVRVLFISEGASKQKGFYSVVIDFKDLGTSSLYITDNKLIKWKWITTQLNDDMSSQELLEYPKKKDFNGSSLLESEQGIIVLEKQDLIEFD
ncbi:recombinase family protein [uncultured Aquimarina sp.]|uniref:recombinase family protein n=1 Tax=uncultured Aquimarina sp. TaxID=575652 RepID=UPI00262445AE|nr:recombinase family protein [uncultured Aquimarina sp.]